MLAKVALDGDHVVGFGDRGRRGSIDAENVFDPRQKIGRDNRRRFARHHRDRVVRTLGRAIETADTSVRIDINLALGIAKDRAGRTTSQAFRVFAVHADRRRKNMLAC